MTATAPTHVQRTYIYVDGFNFYYRAVKNTPYKWLNFMTLFQSVLRPTNDIRKIRYFTAMISGKTDPDGPQRQQTFLRALRTLPQVEVHLGRFMASQKWAPICNKPANLFRPSPDVVSILRTEEKGSDVNLASWLLRDAFMGEFDVAVVVSNDTDLVEPIRMATEELGKVVGLICPAHTAARSLTRVSTFCRFLTPGRLAAAQFPDVVSPRIRKPATW